MATSNTTTKNKPATLHNACFTGLVFPLVSYFMLRFKFRTLLTDHMVPTGEITDLGVKRSDFYICSCTLLQRKDEIEVKIR